MITAIGWVGGVTSTVMLLPQMIALLRTGDTKGMAWPLWVVYVGITLGWISHGINISVAFIVVANVVAAGVTVVSLVYLWRAGKLPSWWLVFLGLAFAVLVIFLDWGVSSAAFGATVVTPVAIAKLHQGIHVMRVKEVTGVSVSSWVVQLANEMIWATWAILSVEPGTIISAIVTGTCNLFVLTWLILRHHGVGPVFPYRAPEQPDPDPARSL